jgi:hypothetical protein
MPKQTALRGIDKVRRRIAPWVAEAAEHAVKETAKEARLTRVFKDRTGKHRASLQGELDRETGTRIIAIVRAGMEYSPYLELGTRRMHARPHLWRAMETIIDSREEFEKRLREDFVKHLRP